MMRFIKNGEKASNVHELLLMFLNPEEDNIYFKPTYTNKECTLLDCNAKRRSFEDILDVVQTYFPNKTEEDLNQALLAFNTILSIDPNNMLAAYYTALTLIESNQYEKAQEVINLLKKVSPENQNILKLEEMINNKKSK